MNQKPDLDSQPVSSHLRLVSHHLGFAAVNQWLLKLISEGWEEECGCCCRHWPCFTESVRGVNPTFLWVFVGWLEPSVLSPGGTTCILSIEMDPTFSQQSRAALGDLLPHGDTREVVSHSQ